MVSIKNKIIFYFICFVLYMACSFLPFLKSFTLLKIFFILPGFLYTSVYSIGIGIASYIFLLVFSIIKLLPYLNSLNKNNVNNSNGYCAVFKEDLI
ncbi:unnamed protein product [Brachyspira suanatina]|uniref:Uncharacterized protein n=1 Tax=Brachyspira suanatina TaxID=381802 RepID=A0A0G4K4C1_9SPIR|nr:hypothetical protein [Brachyspira suanatina]CRF31848.1 unnamed protein product [Brachyspira suanatina]